MAELKICLVSSELAPLAKTGGLADVSAALGRYLYENGHDVRVFIPLYSSIDTASRGFMAVDFLQNIHMHLGERLIVFSVFTAPLPGSDLMVYFIDCPTLYNRPGLYTMDADEHLRFILLCRAAIESCQRMGWGPQIFHCNDWQTALIPLYLKTLYAWDSLFNHSRTVFSIHNIGYQGVISSHNLHDTGLTPHSHLLYQEDLHRGTINFLKTGFLYADLLTTVSPTYAQEIQTSTYGMGLDGLLQQRGDVLIGILNGVDYSQWDPRTDPFIPYKYSHEDLSGKERNKLALLENLDLTYNETAPVLGIVSRLATQKGFDLCFDILPALLRRRDLRIVVLGSGESDYENFFGWLQHEFPHKVCFYKGFNERLAHLIEAGSDLFLMPSRYEPCGLNQMYSLRYGTIPVVRKTGGLADTVKLYDPTTGAGTGVVFEHYNSEGLNWALHTALDLYADKTSWRRIQQNAMVQDFSWERQGTLYVELYQRLLNS